MKDFPSGWCGPSGLVILGLLLGGCGLVGGIYGVFIDPFIPSRTVAAEHDMRSKTILVWIDTEPAGEHYHLLRRELTQQLAAKLLEKQAVGQVIDYPRLTRFQTANPESAQMTLQQLGRQFDADEVLYLEVAKCDLQDEVAGAIYKPLLVGYGKVIETATGNRLWPKDQTERPFTVELPMTAPEGPSPEQQLLRELCGRFAEDFTLFFYKHRPIR